MKRLILLSAIGFSLFLSCSDDTDVLATETSLTGFWSYDKVLINGVDISGGNPELAIRNYLHLKEDHSYGKCYINGVWSNQNKNLKLQRSFDNAIQVYEIINVSKNSLTLQIKLSPNQYGWTNPQFDDDEVITITEYFVKVE